MSEVISYEEWLAFAQDERGKVHRAWDTNAGEGIAIAYMAAARLALRTQRRVLNLQVGRYHCDEYVLHMTVSEAEFENCPPILEESFEGFRVVWLPLKKEMRSPEVDATIEGTWTAERGDYEFTVRPMASGGGIDVTGIVLSSGESLVISGATVNESSAVFSAFDPVRRHSSQHLLKMLEEDRCEEAVITVTCQYYVRHRRSNT